ncbi:MAG: sigma-54-dependent Fis family transcriptional regulator [Acidobacteriota bacterium]|nr:sigma-54-dependent Fis family transcriptional regulator [Acidobacteriota bacterium]
MAAAGTGPPHGVQLPSVLEFLSEPAIVIGEDYRIVAANDAYRERFAGGETVRGRLCYEVSHHFPSPCDELGERCPILTCRQTGEATQALHVHHTPRGEEHHVVTTHPLRDAAGEIHAYLEVIRPSAIAAAGDERERLVGRAPVFNRMLELAARVAPSDTPVLLLGESGTGKELLARAVHARSARARGNFVPLDCSGLSETLFESELFGHEKGAFTGASQSHQGLVEASRGGTLFLDEVGDIPLSLQVKLLRLLETGTFRRVGSAERREVDFRLVCATHRDLQEMIDEGAFRQDLYYRISAFPIRLPPLRERLEDLPLIISHLQRRLGLEAKTIHREALAALEAYHFPGNVRELLNVLSRASLLADGDTILPEHLPDECLRPAPGPREMRAADGVRPLAEIELQYVRWAAARIPDDRRVLASRLGLSERSLYRKLSRLRAVEP